MEPDGRPDARQRQLDDALAELGDLQREWEKSGNPPPIAQFSSFALHLLDVTGGAIITVSVASMKNKLTHLAFRHRPHPPNPVELRAAAIWAINQVYRDKLPEDVEPVAETFGHHTWSIAFDHDGYRYEAAKVDDRRRDIHATISRTAL